MTTSITLPTPSLETSPLVSYFRDATAGVFHAPSGLLRHPFITPGATAYVGQLWDWDSFWMACGLLRLAEILDDAALRERALRHGRGCLLNFFEHQSREGAIPILMKADNPDPFGCLRTDGPEVNHAKPVFGQFALRLASEMDDVSWLEPVFDRLTAFHEHWERKYRSGTGLLVWGSDVAIGVDNDPATYGRPPFSSGSLLLNCLYQADLEAAGALAARLGRTDDARRARDRARAVAAAIQRHGWDRRDRFFYSADVQCRDQRAERIPWLPPGMPMQWDSLPVRIRTFSGFLPLWGGLATPEQAAALRDHLADPATFASASGVRTLARDEPMYSLAASGNPSNWTGPVWLLPNYLAWAGLRRYGFRAEAAVLARKTWALLESDLAATGTIHEYYHPDTGAPLMNPGFLSWNLLALEMAGDPEADQ